MLKVQGHISAHEKASDRLKNASGIFCLCIF